MKRLLVLTGACICIAAIAIVYGCASWGKNISSGALDKFHERHDQIGQDLKDVTADVRNEVLGEATTEKLAKLFEMFSDSLMVLRDSLLGKHTREEIDAIMMTIGNRTGELLTKYRADLLGDITRDSLKSLLHQVQLSVFDSLDIRIAGILRSPATKGAMDNFLDSLGPPLKRVLERDIVPVLDKQQDSLRKNATAIVISLGVVLAIAGIIIVVVVYRIKKCNQLVGIISSQIDEIPSREIYDKLVHGINNATTVSGLEPDLRKILTHLGLLGRERWENRLRSRGALE